MKSKKSLRIGACCRCALFAFSLVGCQVIDAQQPPSTQVVRGQSLDRNSNTGLNDTVSLQERLNRFQQSRRKQRSVTNPLSMNRQQPQTQNVSTNPLQYPPQNSTQYGSQYGSQNDTHRGMSSSYSSSQNNNTIQQASYEYRSPNDDLAQNPVSNPYTTSPYQFEDPNQPRLIPSNFSDDTGIGPVPPALAPPAENSNTLRRPESVFNNASVPSVPSVPEGLSLVPRNQNPQTSGSPGFGSNLDPNQNLLLRSPTEEDIYRSSFLDRLSHFYRQRGLIPQSSNVSMTVIAGSTDDIGYYDLFIQTTFAVESVPGLTFSPSFQVDFLNGPTRTDLPPRLFNMGAEFRLAKPLNDRTSYEMAVRPSVYSDLEAGGAEAARVTGRGIGYYTWSTQTQLVYGLVYLDRKDVPILPVIGIIYVPQGDLRMELVFPRPRISKLISTNGDAKKWGYIAGEFGGGSWAIERPRTVDDVATLVDWRLIFGIENKYANNRSWFFEVGLVFNRELQYETGPGDYDLDSTGMIRAGVIY